LGTAVPYVQAVDSYWLCCDDIITMGAGFSYQLELKHAGAIASSSAEAKLDKPAALLA
jgi:hypothetical protein